MSHIHRIDLLLGPSEFQQIVPSDLKATTCVVFDILRFTTTATMALANGSAGIIPAKSIPDAVELRARYPEAFLAGEREGRRIGAALTGGIEFDYGNSPREFTREAIGNKLVISTTTNGTRALNCCKGAEHILAGSFLNEQATVEWLLAHSSERVCLVCAGTHEENSYEDMLGAGAIARGLLDAIGGESVKYSDSVLACLLLWERARREGLGQQFHLSRNGRNLLSYSSLAEDVPFSSQENICSFAVLLGDDGVLRASQP